MANLSNINNKFIVTDGGDVMINNTIAGYPNGEGLTVKSSDNICRVVLQNSVSGGSVNDGFRIGLVNSNVEFESTESGEFQFYTGGGAAKMTIDSSGKVGIGTDSPDYKLDVRADAGSIGQIFVKGGNNPVTSNGEINSEILFGSNDASVQSGNIGGKISSVTEATNGALTGLAFYTYTQTSPGLDEKMRIRYNGNVGIGTDSPYTPLEVSATDPVIRLNVKSGVTDKSNYEIRGIGASGFEGIQFRTVNDANSVYASLMMIQQGGNVGIGDTSPQGKLEVNNRNTATGAALFIKGGEDDLSPISGQYTGLAFGYGGGDIYNNAAILWEFTNASANGKLHFAVNPTVGDGTANLSDSKMTILDSGNVGIGTTIAFR